MRRFEVHEGGGGDGPHDGAGAAGTAAPAWVVNGRGHRVWCSKNASLTLETDPAWRGVLAYNELHARPVLQRPVPGSRAPRKSWRTRWLADEDITTALEWFNGHGWPRATRNTLIDALLKTARRNSFSPVRDYLSALAWDGEPRIDRWLVTYLGAEDTPFVREVGRCWLIAAVARALRPGCKSDHALILEGEQGGGKSSALRTLGGEWFTDTLRDFTNKDASSGLRGNWIVELPELAAMRRAEVEVVKAYLSRDVEKFRPCYARFEVDEPRRCVFAGTTNSSEYLVDDTGNRRFWPVRCGAIDLAALASDRDQIWAEAVAAFNDGAIWWLGKDMEKVAAVETAARTKDDPWAAKVLAEAATRSEVSTRWLLANALHMMPDKMTKADAMRVAGILTSSKQWRREGKFTGGPERDLARYVRKLSA